MLNAVQYICNVTGYIHIVQMRKVQCAEVGCTSNAKPRQITRPKKYRHILLSPSLDPGGHDGEDDGDKGDCLVKVPLHKSNVQPCMLDKCATE